MAAPDSPIEYSPVESEASPSPQRPALQRAAAVPPAALESALMEDDSPVQRLSKLERPKAPPLEIKKDSNGKASKFHRIHIM